ncbi:MAG: hypothetical protein H0T20_05065 [Actinobacteria bacterium]|nr:hypothetical protein [Actinomycetota bacterium]
MPLRDLFRRRRRERRTVLDEQTSLTEQDVQRLLRIQRTAASSVRVVRGRRR